MFAKVKKSRKEYRIVLPITVEKYQVAQLFSVAKASKNETGGGEGVVVEENKPYKNNGECGQYTKKFFHVQSRVPKFIKMLMPKGSMILLEESWNAYPHCKTVISNPGYMGENFEICIDSLHLPDLGESENVHKLSHKDWMNTEVIRLDFANDPCIAASDYKKELDPKRFHSEKANKGPLGLRWIETLRNEVRLSNQNNTEPPHHMCAYKLVTCHFKWFGLQTQVESLIFRLERRVFTNFHRQVFCWMDMWFDLTINDIRKLEDETKEELIELRKHGEIRGTFQADDVGSFIGRSSVESNLSPELEEKTRRISLAKAPFSKIETNASNKQDSVIEHPVLDQTKLQEKTRERIVKPNASNLSEIPGSSETNEMQQ